MDNEFEDYAEHAPSLDISSVLAGWDHAPHEVRARKIMGEDGLEKIQMRVSLGLIQMETEGRPDGARPHGFESLLEYQADRLHKHIEEHGGEDGFTLSVPDCEAMAEEAYTYYYRYLCFFHTRDFARCSRDTARNLRVLDLIRQYADPEVERYALEQYRPYILMMKSRAEALLALDDDNPAQAGRIVADAIERIRAFYRQAELEVGTMDADRMIEQSNELRILDEFLLEIKNMESGFDPSRTVDISRLSVDSLRRLMEKAVAEEDYERAASLRDQIRERESKRRA